MIKRMELGNTGERISQFALGTMLMGTVMKEDEAFEVLDDYVKNHGGNHIDTANNYAWWIGTGQYNGDESELLLGKWMKARNCRKNLFVASKVGARQKDNMAIRDKDGLPKWDEIPGHLEGASAKTIREGLEASLKRLQTDYLDLYYIHVDDRETPLEETLSEVNALIQEGKIRHYGYSNIQTWRLEQVFKICETMGLVKPVGVQLEYSYISPAKYGENPLGIHAKEDFFDWVASKQGVSLVAYSPLMKGIFVNEKRFSDLLTNFDYNTAYSRERLNRVNHLSAKLGISPNVLVLAWMAQKKEGIFPLLGFSKKEQYQENIAAFDTVLNDTNMKELTF